MIRPRLSLAYAVAVVVVWSCGLKADDLLQQAERTQQRAAEFFYRQVAKHGGYVYQVSADLKHREGEGDAGEDSVWVQPPGTPAVGEAYLQAYELTGEPLLLEAARAAGECLVAGQLHSGGWQNHIDFEPDLRSKLAYRTNGPRAKKAKNWSSLDDDQTQSAVRFLLRLDKALKHEHQAIHDAVTLALSGIIANQFPAGGWAQGFEKLESPDKYPVLHASIPKAWPRSHPKADYWQYYTLNDGALVKLIDTLWLAYDMTGEEKYRASAIRGAEFLLLAQLPEPQPAWAQQYDFQMQPVWARRFEPPAISGGESQGAIECLMNTAERTGERRFLEPVPRALAYLQQRLLSDGKLARFYELGTDKPLYFTKQYELTYDDSDLPTHYGFKVPSNLNRLTKRYEKLAKLSDEQLRERSFKPFPPKKPIVPERSEVEQIVRELDTRGAWVEAGKLKYIKPKQPVNEVIRSETFIHRLRVLSLFIATEREKQKAGS